MKYVKNSLPCYIETVTPVHLGCDEVYEPTGFVVDEAGRRVVVFDPLDFIANLEAGEKGRLSEICSKGTVASILEVFKFMRNRPARGRAIELCEGFIEHYGKTLSIPLRDETKVQQELSRFTIPRTAFLASDQRPYIPGSAVKGALRTAYLNLLHSEEKVAARRKEKKADWLEKNLLRYSSIPEDPFRLIKVSDFMPVGDLRTRIVYGVNEKKNGVGTQTRGIPLLYEVISPGSLFRGTISVEQPHPKSPVRASISIERLLEGIRFFFSREKDREDKELREMGITPTSPEGKVKHSSKGDLLRLGRHSGAESVTIEGHRDIRIMLGRGKSVFKDHATTLWLASEVKTPQAIEALRPFGWGMLCGITEEKVAEFDHTEQEWKEYKREIPKNGDPEEVFKVEKPDPLKSSNPEQIHRKTLLEFEKRLESVRNLPGEIDKYIGAVKVHDDERLRKDLCGLLLEKGKSLPKQKKFQRALKDGKPWAARLRDLCDSCGLQIEE